MEAKVGIAGCGGLGVNVITALAEAGVCRYVLCDHDVPDVTNLNRQFIYSAGDPRPKSMISAEWILALNPVADVEAICEPVTADNGDMFTGCDVIIDCLDSFEARMALNDHSQRMGIPLVHAGILGRVGGIAQGQPLLPQLQLLPRLFLVFGLHLHPPLLSPGLPHSRSSISRSPGLARFQSSHMSEVHAAPPWG